MRRSWMMGVAMLGVLAACRSEAPSDREAGERRAVPGNSALQAQEHVRSPSVDSNADATSVARILAMAQAMSQGEIETGRLAEQRAISDDVKAFATKLVHEHQQDVELIGKLASDKHIDLATAQDDPFVDAKRGTIRQKVQKLSTLSGRAFEEAYMDGQTGDHAMLAALAQEGQGLSKDDAVNNLFKSLVERAENHRGHALAAMPKLCDRSSNEPVPGAPTPPGGRNAIGMSTDDKDNNPTTHPQPRGPAASPATPDRSTPATGPAIRQKEPPPAQQAAPPERMH